MEEGNFADDVEELSFDMIPLLDKDTAEILGDRKMGSMVDMVPSLRQTKFIPRSITMIIR